MNKPPIGPVPKFIKTIDGPEYQPNGRITVVRLRPADIPGFTLCRDMAGKERVIETAKLDRAEEGT